MLEEFSKLESEDASSEEAKKALEYKETCRKDDRAPRESMVNNDMHRENPIKCGYSSSLCIAYDLQKIYDSDDHPSGGRCS